VRFAACDAIPIAVVDPVVSGIEESSGISGDCLPEINQCQHVLAVLGDRRAMDVSTPINQHQCQYSHCGLHELLFGARTANDVTCKIRS